MSSKGLWPLHRSVKARRMTIVSLWWTQGSTQDRLPRTSLRIPAKRPVRPMPGCSAGMSTRRIIKHRVDSLVGVVAADILFDRFQIVASGARPL
jgi:hypothetical protein